jgi:hypothetical protein
VNNKDKYEDEQLDTKSLLERMTDRRSMVSVTSVRGSGGLTAGPGGWLRPLVLDRTCRGWASTTVLIARVESGMADVEEEDETEDAVTKNALTKKTVMRRKKTGR